MIVSTVRVRDQGSPSGLPPISDQGGGGRSHGAFYVRESRPGFFVCFAPEGVLEKARAFVLMRDVKFLGFLAS